MSYMSIKIYKSLRSQNKAMNERLSVYKRSDAPAVLNSKQTNKPILVLLTKLSKFGTGIMPLMHSHGKFVKLGFE